LLIWGKENAGLPLPDTIDGWVLVDEVIALKYVTRQGAHLGSKPQEAWRVLFK